jgi:hypothetical protein
LTSTSSPQGVTPVEPDGYTMTVTILGQPIVNLLTSTSSPQGVTPVEPDWWYYDCYFKPYRFFANALNKNYIR